MKITPKNWGDFQHYARRNPPWIKLHKKLLDDYDFQCLHDASKALAPMLWLLASEESDGVIETTLTKLAFRLRRTEKQIIDGLKPLIAANFFAVEGDDASALLASCLHDATPESERETESESESESETEKAKAFSRAKSSRAKKIAVEADSFEAFWALCPRKIGKGAARRAYATASKKVPHEVLVEGMRRFAASRRGEDEKFTAHPATWLNGERWLDGKANGARSYAMELTPEEQQAEQDALRQVGL